MQCSSCSQENPADARFCNSCGAALDAACPNCQKVNPPGAAFCNGCGQALAPDERPRSATPTPAPAPALPSTFAAGRYEVKGFLGEGGKKRVYLAHDSRLGRDVAVAVIKTDGLDEAGLQRVQREAQAMGRLGDQANIVTVHDIGDDNGQPYIVSQHMARGDLEALLARTDEHRLPIAQALEIGEQICAALDHAHSQAVIHRDLKPGNIWLAEDGSAKLGDFGLAVAIDRSRLTREGMMVGTTSYMPPEQAVGGEVTPRSDLYSLGCVLYEMVTGRPPFLGDDSVAVISQHINTAAVAPSWHNPEVPKALELLIMRLLAKAPQERPDDAKTVASELRAIRERSTVETVAEAQPPSANLQGLAWGQFVGRRQEMDQLKSALESALSGQGTLAMLVGEPGIGKTRLAEEFAVYASLRGAQVLTGRCFEGEVTLPYRPFIEVFQQYVRARPDTELRAELGDGAPEVAKLVSEVRQRFPDIPDATPLEAEAERLRLYESVSSFLRNASAANPVVLVLDDIHWADKPSLLMMRYLARAIGGQRILILGAYRDVELDRTHPLSEVMATLRQETPYQRVLLRGLPAEDVLGLLESVESSQESAAGRQALAAALFQETEGNPFFIREVISHLIEEGKLVHEGGHWTSHVSSVEELGIPEGVREVVGKRLSKVSEGCNRMLTLASSMTGGFSWEELKAIADVGETDLIDLVEEALAAQLIQERKGDQSGTYDFTHALIRQTLYGELSTPRRVLLHRQIGNALEAFYGAGADAHLSELAHHFYQAAPGGDVDKAVDYASRAGDRAVEQLAYEEAAQHYELARQALDLKEAPDERRRFDLTYALGRAYFSSDVPDRATDNLQRAAGLAAELGEPDLEGEAAIGFQEATLRGPLMGQQAAVPLLKRAIDAGPSPSIKARLLARWSQDLQLPAGGVGPREERIKLATEAREVANAAGDAKALSYALSALYVALGGPELVEERLPLAEELIDAAEQAGDRIQLLWGHLFRIADMALLGRTDDMRREIDLTSELADNMREPAYGSWRLLWNAMLALREGRHEEAERNIIECLPIANRTQNPGLIGTTAAQFYSLRWAQGRLSELESIVLTRLEAEPHLAAWQGAAGLLYLDAGDHDKARQWLDRLAEGGIAAIALDFNWIITMLLAADLAYHLHDKRAAQEVYDLVLPYANQQIVVGFAFLCDGSASMILGLAAAAMERWEAAERHYQEAIEFDERTGAIIWTSRAQYYYAEMLRDRDGPGDRDKALSLINAALATFEGHGMARFVEHALALKMELQGISQANLKTSIDTVADFVQTQQPDLRTHAAPDGTVTLLFTDIVDSTPLNERLGDHAWMELLREHNAIVRQHVSACQGYEVKTEGDGFMLAFSSARRAVECAVAIQRAFAERNQSAEEQVHVRAGLHTGEAIQDAGDFYGRHVNLAARIASQAGGGEILVSGLLKELTETGGDIEFGQERGVELKGLTGTQRVYTISW